MRGQATVIAPQVSGYVARCVQDYQQVRRQVLARIDDRIYAQRVEQAKAGVQTQGADLANFAQSRALERRLARARPLPWPMRRHK